MTNTEAINIVQGVRKYLTAGNPIWDVETIDEAMKMAIEALSERTGEWIFEKTDEYKRTYCSVCGVSAPFVCVSDDHYGRRCHGETRKTKFCPNCGARMKGDTE